jgi:uncharacterized small protein (DUF1192 family)
MQTKVEEEAFDAAVALLQGAIALKADQHALDLLGAEVTALGNEIEHEIAQLEAEDEALQAALVTKASQSALDAVFERLQATSAQAASNGMNIQTLQGAATSLFESVGVLDTRVTSNATANTSTQGTLNSTDQALAVLSVRWRASRTSLGWVSKRVASRCSKTGPSRPSWAPRPCR